MTAVNSIKCFAIANRTDNAGATISPDTDWEELRMGAKYAGRRQGILENLLDDTPNPNAFRVRQDTGANMNVKIGSGTTQRDGIVLRGTVAGQGTYVARIDAATITKTAPATDPALAQRYGVFAFIDDASYAGDAARLYCDIAVLRGAPNASPVTPVASAVWSAWALLWEFQLPGGATAVTDAILDSATSFDRRTYADLLGQNILENQVFS